MKGIFQVGYRSVVAALALGAGAGRTAAQQCGPPALDRPAPRPDLVVSTAWLAAHLHDPGVVVVHVDHDPETFRAAHLPGARYADAMAFAAGDHDLPAAADLRRLVENLGIGPDDRVVLYGESWHVGWLYLALDRLGHGSRAALLDGGLAQWRLEGRPVESGPPPAEPRGRLTAREHDVVVPTDWLRDRLGGRRLALIDVRSRDEYVAGHIPTARHLDWSRVFTRPDSALAGVASLLVSADRLDAMFRAAGAAPGKEIVLYCTVGVRASLLYLLAKRLGYSPRLYDGSWAAWSGAGLPTATGPEPGVAR